MTTINASECDKNKRENDLCYLMLRDLILQLRCLSADGFRVDKVLLCGSKPLAQGLQSFMELLCNH